MKRLATIATALLISATATAQPLKLRMAHIGLIYPISSNGINAKEYTNVLSLHAIAGVSRSEIGFCGAGVSNIIFDNTDGVVLGGFSTHIFNNANGFVASGFMNTVKNDVKGVEAAGFLNTAKDVKGAQLAGFTNISIGAVTGFQGAGFANVTTKAVYGTQVAGFVNVTKHAEGPQLAGFINVAEDANMQIAGFINVAKEVRGVQAAGFINIADSSDFPIGIINIIKKGEKAIGFTIDENLTALTTFRSGGRVMYGVIGVGANLRSNKEMYAVEAGLGAHIPVSKGFRINVEATSSAFAKFYEGSYMRSSLRVLPAFMIGNKVEIFAGPTLNHYHSNDYNGDEMSNNYLWSDTYWDYFNGINVGGMAGIQFHL